MFFFFSSRRRHTRLQGDWSSDVCSSDLVSAESLQRANLKREELLLAARSVDPHSPALVKARAAFNSNRILAIARSLGGWPSVQQVDPDTPASTDAVPTASATGP